MLACNSAQLNAQNKNCHVCADSARTCAADPHADACAVALDQCDNSSCRHPIVKDLIRGTCGQIRRPHNYVKF